MTWVYWLMDVVSTGMECVTTCILAEAVCVSKRGSRLRWPPYAIFFALGYLFTWVIDIGAWKMPVLAGVIGTALWLSYGCSIYNALICAFLGFASLGVGEDIGILLFMALGKDIFVAVDGQSFPSVLLYAASLVIRTVVVLFIRRILRNFQYQFTFKDFCIVLTFFAPMFALLNFETVHFIDDNFLDLNIMLLVITLGTALIVLILYLKNYLFLRDKAERDRRMIEQLQRQFAYYQD